jgi:hypothetical protein
LTEEYKEEILLSKERIEEHLGFALTDDQYPEVAKAIFELASLLIESTSELESIKSQDVLSRK